MTNTELPLLNKRVAFCGKLGGVSKREAFRLVKNCGGSTVDADDADIDLVVLGAEELPIFQQQELLNDRLRGLVRRGQLEVISETRLWEKLGFVEQDVEVQRLYTPAMIAELLKLSVAEIRKWHRCGLITPFKEVHRLPYFDFQEVNTARRLSEMVQGGASPNAIKRNLEKIAEFLPEIERPLAQLSIIVEGKNLFLRRDDGVIETNGQIRLDFNSPRSEEIDDEEIQKEEENDDSLLFPAVFDNQSGEPDYSNWSYDDLIDLACQYEDQGEIQASIEVHRCILMAHGPQASVNFQLAELLYQLGQLEAARERYYVAIELDEEFVEARANLGCLLNELGQYELAVSAFEGALDFHAHFPDVHFHLARTLDRLKRQEDAEMHWRSFLQMAPESPWAAEARERLNLNI